MANRDLFQVDKTAFKNQIFLGAQCQCRQNTDMDSYTGLCHSGYRQKKLALPQTMYKILQILSITIFDKTPINQLFKQDYLQNFKEQNYNQLKMFDLER